MRSLVGLQVLDFAKKTLAVLAVQRERVSGREFPVPRENAGNLGKSRGFWPCGGAKNNDSTNC